MSQLDLVQLATGGESAALEESRRVMEICNACRYCEGFCAVFPAMTRRRSFAQADLDYLANLCHGCGACYHACQYAPPHPFDINVPRTMADVRLESYARFAWPARFAPWFTRNGMVVSLTVAVVVALTLGLTFGLADGDVLWARHSGPGAFYAVIDHAVMVVVAGVPFMLAVLAMAMSARQFWRARPDPRVAEPVLAAAGQSAHDIATLRYLGGGHGEGCNVEDASFSNARRYFHQATMWGFLACFAATCIATVYDLGFGWQAPYALWSLPVVFGTIGGVGLLIGPAGLLWIKLRTDSQAAAIDQYGMDVAFLAQLFLVGLTGLALLALRDTSAMGVLLAVHLGFVVAFFTTLPYSKFVHGIYRSLALLQSALEQRRQ